MLFRSASLDRAELAIDRGELQGLATLISEVEGTADAAGWTQLACRAGVLRAECALRHGHVAEARRALDRRSASIAEHGYGVLRVHVAALEAGIARAGGRLDEDALGALAGSSLGHPWAERALARAAVRLRLEEPTSIELLSQSGRVLLSPGQLDELDLSAHWVVDHERGRARRGERHFDLRRRRSLLDVLAALASPPGAWLTPTELAWKAWRLDYHALRHHSRLAMAIARLRDILGPEAIEGTRDGYRLAEADSWAVVRSATCDPM